MEMKSANQQGFTLIEMMAAMTLLVVMMVLITQIVSSVATLTDLSKRKMDAITQATFALDRLEADLRRAIHRADLLPDVAKQPGNDVLSFFSQVSGYGGNRGVSALSYSIQAASGEPIQFYRGVTGAGWTSDPLPFSATSNAGAIVPAPDDNLILAPAVYRFEVSFINADTGLYMAIPVKADWSDVGSIVVTVAAIDDANKRILGANSPGAIAAAAALLTDADGVGSLSEEWQQALNAHAAEDTLSARTMSRSRIRQRIYDW